MADPAASATSGRATSGVRLFIIGAIVLAVLFVAYKVSYTNVPPERLAAREMIDLAAPAQISIAEVFQAYGTLEGRTDAVMPATTSDIANSRGPFVWTVGADGAIHGKPTRYAVTLDLTTADEGGTWTCVVTPAEFAPSVGPCVAKH